MMAPKKVGPVSRLILVVLERYKLGVGVAYEVGNKGMNLGTGVLKL